MIQASLLDYILKFEIIVFYSNFELVIMGLGLGFSEINPKP